MFLGCNIINRSPLTRTRCKRKMPLSLSREKDYLKVVFVLLVTILVYLASMPRTFVFNPDKKPYLWQGCLHNLTAWWNSPYSHAFADGVYLSTDFVLKGRGNIMFQYASLLGIAHSTGRSPVVPKSLELHDYFDLSALCVTDKRPGVSWGKVVERKASSYDPKIATLQSDVNLELIGYFQSWRYFRNNEDRVRKEFTFKANILQKAAEFLNASMYLHNFTTRPTLIAIHVRKGDMTSQLLAGIGYTTADEEYFRRAMHFFELRHPNILYVVCSDNITWSRDHVRSDRHPMVFSESSTEPGPAAVDLAIMSQCNHSIISSGTFSWWVGWLAGGDVVYYKKFPRPNSRLERTFSKSKKDYYWPGWVGM